jgi:hypothetical protein
MKAKVLKRGEKVQVIEDFDQITVETDGGAYVCVVSRYGPDGAFIVSSIDDDPKFQEILGKLGLNRSRIVTDIKDLMKSPHALSDLSI